MEGGREGGTQVARWLSLCSGAGKAPQGPVSQLLSVGSSSVSASPASSSGHQMSLPAPGAHRSCIPQFPVTQLHHGRPCRELGTALQD